MKLPIVNKVPPLIACLVVLLMACNSGGGDSPSPSADKPNDQVSVSSTVPSSLTMRQQGNTTLLAQLRIDNGSPLDMAVDANNDQVSVTMDALTGGDYTFSLLYRFDVNTTVVDIAQAEVTQTIVYGQDIDLVFSALTYLDDDLDGFTNLAELAAGTDWNDMLDKPLAEFPRGSSSYVIADIVVPNPTKEGAVVAGSAASTNYALEP